MLVVLLLPFLFFAGSRACEGYYWREYLGTVPNDAFVAGKDIAGRNVYIGQAYIKRCGLVVVQITPGEREVIAPIGGAKKTNKYTKILCGSPQDLYWLKANATTLNRDLEGKTAVIGGQEDTYGVMNIGRIFSGGETKIGKVNSFWNASSTFYYIDNGKEKSLKSYEILMTVGDGDITANQLYN